MPETLPPVTSGAPRRPCCGTLLEEEHDDSCRTAYPFGFLGSGNYAGVPQSVASRDPLCVFETKIAETLAMLSGHVLEVRRTRLGLEIRLRPDVEAGEDSEQEAPEVVNYCARCHAPLSPDEADDAFALQDGLCRDCYLTPTPGEYVGG